MEQEIIFTQVVGTLDEVLSQFESVKTIAATTATAEDLQKLDMVESVIDGTKLLINSADPMLCPKPQLENLSSYLTTIKDHFTDSLSQETINGLNVVSDHAESIKMILPYLIPRPNDAGVEFLRETVVKARRSASQYLRALSTEVTKDLEAMRGTLDEEIGKANKLYEEKHTEIIATYEEKIKEFDETIEEKQKKFNEMVTSSKVEISSLKTLSAETNESINSQKDRLDTAIAEFQKQFSTRIAEFQGQFSEAEEERRKNVDLAIQNRERSFAKEMKKRDADFDVWKKQFSSSLESQKHEFEQTSEKLIGQLREHAQEAKVTVGLISEKSLQSDFITQADKEKGRAFRWNLATFISVILLLVAIGYIFFHTFVDPTISTISNYPQVLSKFLVTAVIGVIARWTSRQANRHLAEERRLRRLALELATINPFLNNLPDEIQFKVKEILAMRYYGNHDDEKAPFGEITIPTENNSSFKSVPEAILDGLRDKPV